MGLSVDRDGLSGLTTEELGPMGLLIGGLDPTGWNINRLSAESAELAGGLKGWALGCVQLD